MKALHCVRNKRIHEAVFREHCLHQATKLGISIYEASRNGIYLQSIDAEGLVAVLNHRVHGNAGITGKRVFTVFVAGSGIGALILASAVLGAKSAIGIESMDKIFDAATMDFRDTSTNSPYHATLPPPRRGPQASPRPFSHVANTNKPIGDLAWSGRSPG